MPRPEVLLVAAAVFFMRGATFANSCFLASRSSTTASKDPVGVLDLPREIVLEVAGPKEGRVPGQVEGAGLQPGQALEASLHGRVAVGSGPRKVEQDDVQALGDDMGGYLNAHGPRPQHDDLLHVGPQHASFLVHTFSYSTRQGASHDPVRGGSDRKR
jgi:hypothetical protein